MKMTSATLTAAIAALESKNVSFDLTGECSKISWYEGTALEEGTFYGVDFGVALGKGFWGWYRIAIDFNTCEVTGVSFRQRYNQNIGATCKSYSVGRKVGAQMEKLTGINFNELY